MEDSTDAQAFLEEWVSRFGDTPPLGWKLRAKQTIPWIRYHALPGSKRYAENEEERVTVLQRGNAIGDRLLGRRNACWYAEAVWDETEPDLSSAIEFREIENGEKIVRRFQVRAVEWGSGEFDEKLRSIANDELRGMWVRRSDGAVFAPYDGGFDLFPSSFDQIADLKRERPEWLPSNPDGL